MDASLMKASALRLRFSQSLYHRAECLTHVGDSQAVRLTNVVNQ